MVLLFQCFILHAYTHTHTHTLVTLMQQVLIPRFYFPNGKPCPEENMEQCLKDVAKVFQDYPKGEVPQSAFHQVTKVI